MKYSAEIKPLTDAEIERVTDKNHLFGVSARWGRDPDPVRRQRSNIDCLAQRIVEMISSGEAQEQIILKPLTQLIDIQSILRDHIESERHQLDSDQSAESRALELKTLELDISELEQEKKRETQESREEHRRALETLQKAMRDRLLKPLTALHDSIEEQVTESYVRRMIANKASTIGLPEELDQQYGQLTRQLEVLWREEKKRLHETLQGLQGSYLEKMNQHAHHIDSNLQQMNLQLPPLALNLDFDLSALEEYHQRSAQLNGELERLEEEVDAIESDIVSTAIDEQRNEHRRLLAEAERRRVQQQKESLGPPPQPVIYSERRKESDWGSGFLWLSATYETVTRKDYTNVEHYQQERERLNALEREQAQDLKMIIEKEKERTGRRMSLEAAKKKLDRDREKREKELKKHDEQAFKDEGALIEETLKKLRRNTLNQLTASIEGVERYLEESLRQLFTAHMEKLVECVQEQMIEPLNAKRSQKEEIQQLLQQSQEQIAARRAELTAAQESLAEVHALTQTALQAT